MNKTAIMTLESYKYETQYHNEKIKDLDKLKNEIYNIETIIFDRKVKNFDFSMEKAQYERLKAKYFDEQTKLNIIETKKKHLENEIEKLQQPYKNILFLKYIKNYTFDEIATKMNYSSKRIYQLHKIAITNYTKLHEESLLTISKS